MRVLVQAALVEMTPLCNPRKHRGLNRVKVEEVFRTQMERIELSDAVAVAKLHQNWGINGL